MNIMDVLFCFLVFSFVVLSFFEMVYMIYMYLHSSNKDVEMEKMKSIIYNMETEIKNFKKQKYTLPETIEGFDYKFNKLDITLTKMNRRIRELERVNKLYEINI